MDSAQAIIAFFQLWGIIGAVVALPFLIFGIDRIDEDARDAYVFRPLLIPGILLIWPIVLWRWWQIESESSAWMSRYRTVRKAHGRCNADGHSDRRCNCWGLVAASNLARRFCAATNQ